MSDWKSKLFKEIVHFPPKVFLEKKKSYSFIPMEDVDGINKYATAISEKVWTGGGGAKFEEGDTLFARITPCLQNGKIAQAKYLREGKGFGSTEFFIFRGVEDVSDSEFIYYLSQTEDFRKHAIGSMVGASGRQRADATFVGNYEVSLPPLPTQRKISSILSAYDELIENNLKRIKLLEELAQRTYEEWFVKFKVKGEALKVDEETRLPKGWAKVSVGEFIQFQKGKKVNLVVENYHQGLEKVLLLDGIESGVYPYTDPSGQVIAERGNLLMLMDGARSSKVFFADRGVVGSTMARVVINNSLVSPTLLRNFFDYNFDLMRTNNTGAAIPHANKGFISNMLFPMPPEKVLKLWNDKVEPIYRLLENLKEQNWLLKEARDILLPRLMSGVIDVEESEEETLAIAAEPKLNHSLKK